MPFQFQCPQGHLLEGEPSQAGQQCHCPTCGMLFIIPAPIAAPVVPAGGFTPYTPPAPSQPPFSAGPPAPAPSYPGFTPGGAPAGSGPTGSGPAISPMDPVQPAEPEILHIPCPNGHELETPVDMLDQDVLCPQCQAQFRLRRKDSVEFKKKADEAEQIRLAKLGNKWLNGAIVAVVLVALGLIALMIMKAYS